MSFDFRSLPIDGKMAARLNKFTFEDSTPSERVEYFFTRYLKHTKGEHAGKPFVPASWQMRDIIQPVFDTLRPDGLRQYRTVPVFLPRKNGKSTMCAGFSLYGLCGDCEPGAEVICAAGSRDQAAIVFDAAAQMVRASPDLSEKLTVLRREIVHANGSVFRCVAADGALLHGLNASHIIEDEIHVWPDRELHEALATSVVSRRQPLLFQITTAGHDRSSFCYEVYSRSKTILEARRAGKELDDTWLPVIYEAGEHDDWTQEETWRKANPGYGVSVKRDYFIQKVNEAKTSPAELNSFLRLHLNRWTDSSTLWLNMDRWDACAVPRNEWPDLAGRTCFAALDLSSTLDLSALVLAFPVDERIYLVPHAWTTDYAIKERERRNKIRFDKWGAAGHLTVIPGEVIEYELIKKHIKDLATKYRIKELALDRWGAAQFIQDMQQEGLEVVGFGQGFAGISAATKAFESAVIGGKLVHDGHPVLRWCVGNTVVDQDPAGNVKPSKGKSTEKIDLCVASIMALARAQLGGSRGTSIYETRGLAAL